MAGWNTIGYGSLSSAWSQAYAYRDALRSSRTSAAADTQAAVPAKPTASGTAPAVLPAAVPETRLPAEADLNNGTDNLGRMRIHFPGEKPDAVRDVLDKAVDLMNNLMGVRSPDKPGAIPGEVECQTCANRKYQDGSDDPGVSFKTPTALSPDEAAAAVRGHEQEHVVRERAEAAREGKKVVSQSVTIHTDICPECGRVYVSGGTTRTKTASRQSAPPVGGFEATA